MFTHTVLVENQEIAPIRNALTAMSALIGAKYQTAERVQLTITTDNERLAEAIRTLVGGPVAEPPGIRRAGKKHREMAEAAGTEPEGGTWQASAEEAQTGEPIKPHQDGLIPCDLEARTQICPHCQQPFIRTRAGQKYCKKPDCQKAEKAAYQRTYAERRKREQRGEWIEPAKGAEVTNEAAAA